ncbi:hypothetical protein FQN57_002448 [Myotisia sp. PD_48]|nr:hypothetical protein FQN57_002448 [Myotisia sp. PD_48]
MFTATKVQAATYLLAVCPFSIAFLVFMNSSVSFVVTDLINLESGHGDAVGTLGFADELLALFACPLWGMISDRIGTRYVSTAGYAIVALSLVLFVQARNVYPELLLGRLLFCLGGSAVATMVTAILPSITADKHVSDEDIPPGLLTNTQAHDAPLPVSSQAPGRSKGSAPRLAGFVGMLTGCGALISLLLFLPLPVRFEKAGYSAAQAIRLSYYTVAAIALVISIICFVGLRGLSGDEGKNLSSLFGSKKGSIKHTDDDDCQHDDCQTFRSTSSTGVRHAAGSKNVHVGCPGSFFKQFSTALQAGWTNSNIGLAYVGGFVARASSVGISLFIPLYVNQYYRHSGLCHEGNTSAWHSSPDGDGDIKKSCPRAYVVASILTGVSQLIALLSAPIFGFLSEKSRIHNIPLQAGALAGVIGYVLLAGLPNPRIGGPQGNAPIFFDMALLGISQISAIVCSLAILSTGILPMTQTSKREDNCVPQSEDPSTASENDGGEEETMENGDESAPLLLTSRKINGPSDGLVNVKGSIAGMYSLWGGAGILILTKAGGLMFDKLSPQSPFYILAVFNGLLLVCGFIIGCRHHCISKRRHR